MKHTLATAGHLLTHDRSPRQNYEVLLRTLMERGSPWLKPQKKGDLRWIGDKKPFQHIDPQLTPFIMQHFPDAHFLHLVRHPSAVAMSSETFNDTGFGDFWVELSLEEKVERWAKNELLVAQLRAQMPSRVYTLRYEDLCRRTAETLSGVFHFLRLPSDDATLRDAKRQTIAATRPYPRIKCSEEVKHIARQYGYNAGSSSGWWNAQFKLWWSTVIKKLPVFSG